MKQKIKKTFSFLFKKRKVVFLFLFLVFIGLTFPLHQARAVAIVTIGIIIVAGALLWKAGGTMVGKWAGAKVLAIMQALAVTLLQIPLALANVALAASMWILSLVTHPNFISLSYTRLDNPIVNAGWTITRGLANMGVVLVLIVIGLATILRIESYQAKKTLPLLIMVALLINFSPVILGLFVDAANIIMNYLLVDYADSLAFMSRAFRDQYTVVWDSWSEIANVEDASRMDFSPIGRTLVLIFFALIAAGILFIFSVLFILRYIAIWMTVILSPLAFLAYVLPATRGFFNRWLRTFLQWCFVGVVAAFFLYLSSIIIDLAQNQNLISVRLAEPKDPNNIPGVLNSLLPYGVVIGFLIVGFIATLSISAAGASTVINLSKRSGKWVGGKAGRGVGRFVQEKARLKEAAGWVSKKVEAVPAARWFLPEKIKKYGEFRPAIERGQAEAKTYSSVVNADDVMKGAVIGERATGRVLETVTRGDSQDLFKAAKKAYSGMDEKTTSDEEVLKDPRFRKKMRRILRVAKNGGLLNNIVRRDPRLAALLAGQKWADAYADMSEPKAVAKATAEARPKHITDWEREVLENEDVVETLMATGGRRIWSAVENVKQGQTTAQGTIDKIYTKSGAANWDDYVKDFKPKHKGKMAYADALEYQGFTAAGWKPGGPEKEEKPPVAGAAAGVTPPPPRGRRAGGAEPTIEERLRPPGKLRPPAGMAYSPSGEIKPEEQARKEWEEVMKEEEKRPRARPGPGVKPSKKPRARGGPGV